MVDVYDITLCFWCLQEALMQQPLTHLYFFTVLENVASLNFGLSGLITTSQKISKVTYLRTFRLWLSIGACRCVLVQFVCFYVSEQMFSVYYYASMMTVVGLDTTHNLGPTIWHTYYSVSIGLKDTPVPVVVSNAVEDLWLKMSSFFCISRNRQLFRSSSGMLPSTLTSQTIPR